MRLSSPIKALLTICCSTAVSICSSIATRRFDAGTRPWLPSVVVGMLMFVLLCVLITRESKEEAELRSIKEARQRLKKLRRDELEIVSHRIQTEMGAGDLKKAESWAKYRRRHYGQ